MVFWPSGYDINLFNITCRHKQQLADIKTIVNTAIKYYFKPQPPIVLPELKKLKLFNIKTNL